MLKRTLPAPTSVAKRTAWARGSFSSRRSRAFSARNSANCPATHAGATTSADGSPATHADPGQLSGHLMSSVTNLGVDEDGYAGVMLTALATENFGYDLLVADFFGEGEGYSGYEDRLRG